MSGFRYLGDTWWNRFRNLGQGGAGGGAGPRAVAGLFLWYRADQEVYQDVAKTTPATGNGDAVKVWGDLGPNGIDLVEATNNPDYQTSVFNGNPIVRFNGANDRLTTAAFAAQAQPNTVFCVARTAEITIALKMLYDGIVGTNRHVLGKANSGGVKWFMNAGLSFFDGLAAITPIVFSQVFNGASSILRANQVQSTGNASTNSLTGLKMGRDNADGNFFQGDIAEWIMYNRQLTTPEILKIEQYLANRYGITF